VGRQVWLPIRGRRRVRILQQSVTDPATGRSIIVFVPELEGDDPEEAAYTMAGAVENTQGELRRMGPRPLSTWSRDDIRGYLKEQKARWQRQRDGTGNRRYF